MRQSPAPKPRAIWPQTSRARSGASDSQDESGRLELPGFEPILGPTADVRADVAQDALMKKQAKVEAEAVRVAAEA